MPYVYIKRDPSVISDALIAQIKPIIRGIVAKNLKCAEGPLEEKDIELFFSDYGQNDVWSHALEIKIEANFYAERNANINDRAYGIVSNLYTSTDDKIPDMSVWIQLFHGGYCASKDGRS